MGILRVVSVIVAWTLIGATNQVHLRGGETATFSPNGRATITDKHGKVTRRTLSIPGFVVGGAGEVIPSQADRLRRLLAMPRDARPYKPNTLIVVFDPADAPSVDRLLIHLGPHMTASAPNYSTSPSINRTLARLGADSIERIAKSFDRSTLRTLRATAAAKGSQPRLSIADAYRVHIVNSSVQHAVDALRSLPGVAYVSPDYYVTTMQAPYGTLSRSAVEAARARAVQAGRQTMRSVPDALAHQIPDNYAVSTSAQSFLNAPGVDAVKAYDEIESTFNQLPGTGELIANVSIGDVDDETDTGDPCYAYAAELGPTTLRLNGQHYIDWPSMPLIPAYVVDSDGNASGSAEACGIDPSLGEIGLDFSVMAPLPHELQRGGEVGAAYSDLLGIAPGAKYELFVPQSGGATTSDMIETFIAAAMSSPRPDVITASVGFGFDIDGFPGRFFEDNPLNEATIATLVNGKGIVVVIAANDGTRTFTPAAIGPAGGSAATNLIPASGTATDVNDLAFTTAPSSDYDSGAIDAGGATLDDIFASPIGEPMYAKESNQLAWPETRWTGFGSFSSGFGTRVDVSAPSDNILALTHNFDGNDFFPYDSVSVSLQGGTSAAAPEVAAVAAVVLQVGRLTGHPFATPQDVRKFLKATGRAVPNVPQADEDVNVGPQVDLGEAVDTLLRRSGKRPSMAVPRIAIAQRRDNGNYGGAFLSDTLPGAIDLTGPRSTALDEIAPITIAPDWEGLPVGTKFRLAPVNRPNAVLATTPWARLMPEQILRAAGVPATSTTPHTVELAYTARAGARFVSGYTTLTFGAAPAVREGGLAPQVAPVTSGSTIDVTYDLRNLRSTQQPRLVVSEPGRMVPTFTPFEGSPLFHPVYTVALTNTHGTVHVPVSALQGAGVYGVTVQYGSIPGGVGVVPEYTYFAFTRVVAGSSVKAEPVPLATDGTAFSHTLYLNYRQRYQVRWNVSNVPGADGALLEIGPPAPGVWSSYNTFNNPNGSIRDDNGIDSSSIYTQRLSGRSGTVTLNGLSTLTPALSNQIRVIPMHGSQAAGEAGDPSFLGMNGFVSPDGNPLYDFKFGDAGMGVLETLLTGNLGPSLIGVLANNVYPIDGKTGAAGKPLLIGGAEGGNAQLYYGLEGSIFSGNLQVVSAWNYTEFGLGNLSSYPPQYGLLNLNLHLAPGQPQWGSNIGSNSWYQLPSPGLENEGIAYNRTGNLALFAFEPLSSGGPPQTYFATSSLPQPQSPSFPASGNLIGLTFGTAYNVTAAYTLPSGDVEAGGVSVDPQLDEGIVEVGPPLTPGAPCSTGGASQVATVSLATGAVTTFAGAGHGPIATTTYDPGTHLLAALDNCGDLILTNVASKTTTTVPVPAVVQPSQVPVYLSADTKHHLLLLGSSLDPAYLTNDDAGSAIMVYDESGNLRKILRGFEYYASGLPGYLELDETNRRLFVPELSGTMIEPAAY